MDEVHSLAEWVEMAIEAERDSDPQISYAFSGLLDDLIEASTAREAREAFGLFQDELAYLRKDRPMLGQLRIQEFFSELDRRLDLIKDEM